MTPEYMLFQLIHCAASQLMLRKESRPDFQFHLFSLADFLRINVFLVVWLVLFQMLSRALSLLLELHDASAQTETHL